MWKVVLAISLLNQHLFNSAIEQQKLYLIEDQAIKIGRTKGKSLRISDSSR
jgi:hypothetical protein